MSRLRKTPEDQDDLLYIEALKKLFGLEEK
jgi:hypothetical protein